jgi:putative oxidoreductase
MLDLGLLIVRAAFGLCLAAHGAQKMFGWFGGPGLTGTTGFLASLGLRPARFWAIAAALIGAVASIATTRVSKQPVQASASA